MEITIGLWVVPVLLSAGITFLIVYGFDYSSGNYFPSFTPIFTIPLWAFLNSFIWMIYFATMYFLKG